MHCCHHLPPSCQAPYSLSLFVNGQHQDTLTFDTREGLDEVVAYAEAAVFWLSAAMPYEVRDFYIGDDAMVLHDEMLSCCVWWCYTLRSWCIYAGRMWSTVRLVMLRAVYVALCPSFLSSVRTILLSVGISLIWTLSIMSLAQACAYCLFSCLSPEIGKRLFWNRVHAVN